MEEKEKEVDKEFLSVCTTIACEASIGHVDNISGSLAPIPRSLAC